MHNLIQLVDGRLRALAPTAPAKKAVAVFDCDGTVIKGDAGESMLYYQLEHFLFRTSPATCWPDHPERDALDLLYRRLSNLDAGARTRHTEFGIFVDMILGWYFGQLREGKTEKGCADIVRLFAGFTQAEARAIADTVVTAELRSPFGTRMLHGTPLPSGMRFIRDVVSLLRHLQHMDWDLWVVSGSNCWSVEAVFSSLGVPLDHIIGIDLVTADGHLTPEVIQPVPVLQGKVEALRLRAPAQPIIVVSDSPFDIPLFRYSAGIRVLVHSGNGSADEFFNSPGAARDGSWIVLESPSVEG